MIDYFCEQDKSLWHQDLSFSLYLWHQQLPKTAHLPQDEPSVISYCSFVCSFFPLAVHNAFTQMHSNKAPSHLHLDMFTIHSLIFQGRNIRVVPRCNTTWMHATQHMRPHTYKGRETSCATVSRWLCVPSYSNIEPLLPTLKGQGGSLLFPPFIQKELVLLS